MGSTYIDAGAIATYSMRVRVRDAVGNIRTGGNVSAKTLATITKTYALSSSQTYRGSAGSKYTKYATELMQGTYDSTLASTRNTLMIFPHATIRTDTAGATINSVRLRVKRLNTAHGNSGKATLYVRSHNYSSMPSTWYNSGVTQRATAAIGRGQELWITLPVP